MRIKVIVHNGDDGGLWAEVPAIPGCGAEAKTLDDLTKALRRAIEENLDINSDDMELPEGSRLVQIDV